MTTIFKTYFLPFIYLFFYYSFLYHLFFLPLFNIFKFNIGTHMNSKNDEFGIAAPLGTGLF